MGRMLYTWDGKLDRLDFGVYCAGEGPEHRIARGKRRIGNLGRVLLGRSWRLFILRRGSCDSDLSLMA